MTTRHTVTLAVALLAVAAADNATAKQFLKVSEVAARKAQLASGNTSPSVDAIETQQQEHIPGPGIGDGDGMLPTQPMTGYSEPEAIQQQQEVAGPVLTRQIGLAGSAIESAPALRPGALKPVQVAAMQPPKTTAAKRRPTPARVFAAPRSAQPRSVAAAAPAPAPDQESAPKATPEQEAQLAESKRGMKAAQEKLRGVLSRIRGIGKPKETTPPPEE